jgi:phospholipase/carboxylesterase
MTKLSGPMLAPANGQAPDAAVVLLHGYGSDGKDLMGLAPYWQQALPGALFVSPNAPQALGMGGYQWFPIDWTGDRLASRQTGVIAARPVLVDFLNDLWSQTGLTPARTVLAGFSQAADRPDPDGGHRLFGCLPAARGIFRAGSRQTTDLPHPRRHG